jgi:hypothetical protein
MLGLDLTTRPAVTHHSHEEHSKGIVQLLDVGQHTHGHSERADPQVALGEGVSDSRCLPHARGNG